ncbi:MAG: hypothetical protein R2795_20790 [Saprospiraceae bacterium]
MADLLGIITGEATYGIVFIVVRRLAAFNISIIARSSKGICYLMELLLVLA